MIYCFLTEGQLSPLDADALRQQRQTLGCVSSMIRLDDYHSSGKLTLKFDENVHVFFIFK